MSNVLITGASSGIGLELARCFAIGGHRLILTARNQQALQSLAAELRRQHSVDVDVIVADLATSAAPGEIVAEVSRRGLSIDVLVNSAGFGAHGPLHQTDLDEQRAMVDVNVSALISLTHLLLPGMIARGSGRILNIASTAAFVPGPYMSTYYATKAFVLSHSLALAHELRHKGVTVTCLCPGPTQTDFQRRARVEKSKLFRLKVMDAATVARAGYQATMRGKRLIVPGWTNRLVVLASRFAPRPFLARIAGRLNRVD